MPGNIIIVVGTAGENSPVAKLARQIARCYHLVPEVIDKDTPRAEGFWVQTKDRGLFPDIPHYPMIGTVVFAVDPSSTLIDVAIDPDEETLLRLTNKVVVPKWMKKGAPMSPLAEDALNGPLARLPRFI